MSVFHFRLARLLRVRAVEETIAREQWSTSEFNARSAESELDRRRDEIARAENELRVQQCEDRIAPIQVITGARLLDELRRAARTAHERARTLRFQADQLRNAWSIKSSGLKGLQRLEERDRAAATSAANALETRTIDEIATMRAARSRTRVRVPMIKTNRSRT